MRNRIICADFESSNFAARSGERLQGRAGALGGGGGGGGGGESERRVLVTGTLYLTPARVVEALVGGEILVGWGLGWDGGVEGEPTAAVAHASIVPLTLVETTGAA